MDNEKCFKNVINSLGKVLKWYLTCFNSEKSAAFLQLIKKLQIKFLLRKSVKFPQYLSLNLQMFVDFLHVLVSIDWLSFNHISRHETEL